MNITKHPKSQSWPIDKSGQALRSGKRCALPAVAGSVGIGNVAVCVECIFCPFGTWTVSEEDGCMVCLLVHGVELGK